MSGSFPPFRPHPLLPSGHAQTVAGAFLPGRRYWYRAERHRVELADGNRIQVSEFFDEDDELVRTMTYREPRQIAGRSVPTVMRVVPADAPDEFTEVRYESLEFGVDLPASTFRLQSLRR